ncbi:MAG: hypothetical protein DMG83_20430 [Acidobacteria bacterium]|jgi:hypothetical protein|nr:MAG: hypothetical protein DMG83_20430 [Acidobacteriota bacterium]
MRNELCFSTFDPLFSDAPSLCDICETKPSVFQFESGSTESDAATRPVKGYCCASCAVQLLNKLQDAESLAWAAEEVSVQKDGMDVSDFHTRRLATFGTHGHN